MGAVLGIVNGLRIYLMYTFLYAGQYDNVIGYAIVVSVSLFFSVILAKLVGGMLPLAAKKLGADPAIMATPFITTIVDACSLILYFQIAQAGVPQYDVTMQKRPRSSTLSGRRARSTPRRNKTPVRRLRRRGKGSCCLGYCFGVRRNHVQGCGCGPAPL